MGTSKYFSESTRNKDLKRGAAAGPTEYASSPDISKAIVDKIEILTMDLIRSGEDLLGTFYASSVDSVPDGLVDEGMPYTRIEDYITPQTFNTTEEHSILPKLQKEASVIISGIEESLKKTRDDSVEIMPYYGLVVGSSNQTFIPRVIRYNGEGAYYDVKVADLPDNSRMVDVKISLKRVK